MVMLFSPIVVNQGNVQRAIVTYKGNFGFLMPTLLNADPLNIWVLPSHGFVCIKPLKESTFMN